MAGDCVKRFFFLFQMKLCMSDLHNKKEGKEDQHDKAHKRIETVVNADCIGWCKIPVIRQMSDTDQLCPDETQQYDNTGNKGRQNFPAKL